MIKVLITEDDALKSRSLITLLREFSEVTFDTASDINSAKTHLVRNQYDLLILDLCLPDRYGDDPRAENSIGFLDAIDKSRRIIKPFHIIGLTAFEDLRDEYRTAFEDHLWTLIHYRAESNSWEKQVRNKIEYLLNSKREIANPQNQQYGTELCVITALREPELTAVLDLCTWTSFKVSNDHTQYYRARFEGAFPINVIAASTSQMGMVATTALSIKMLSQFKPKYLAMCGIAGGVKGKGNLGDVIVAETAFDYGSGKLKAGADGVRLFEPDFRQIDITPELKQEVVSSKADRAALDSIRSSWKGSKPSSALEVIVGPLGSGSGVVEYEGAVNEIRLHSRKLVGVDMETYGMYYAANHCSHPRPLGFISIKSISDFTDPNKSDDYQAYASHTSANFLYHFFTERFEIKEIDRENVS